MKIIACGSVPTVIRAGKILHGAGLADADHREGSAGAAARHHGRFRARRAHPLAQPIRLARRSTSSRAPASRKAGAGPIQEIRAGDVISFCGLMKSTGTVLPRNRRWHISPCRRRLTASNADWLGTGDRRAVWRLILFELN